MEKNRLLFLNVTLCGKGFQKHVSVLFVLLYIALQEICLLKLIREGKSISKNDIQRKLKLHSVEQIIFH